MNSKIPIFIHTCCTPCILIPERNLRKKKIIFVLFFHNPNVHPYNEYRKRFLSLLSWNKNKKLILKVERTHDTKQWSKNMASYKKKVRCFFCYYERLEETASTAKRKGLKHFSTSLLYSIHQDHNIIKLIGKFIAAKHKITFIYQDFRSQWTKNNIFHNYYRQKYCGCLFSKHNFS